MLTLTRKDMLLTINDNVIPAMGSSDVPVKFVNDTETYQGFLIEPRVGYYVNGCPKSGICEYDTSSNVIKIPAEAFKNKGILVISIALIDSEDPNHIEVTKELALEVTPAPNGTIIFPSEDTWQTIVLNLINQFFVTSNEIKNQIKYAVDQAIEDGSLANMTIEDGSITTIKLADETITKEKLDKELFESLQSAVLKDNNGRKYVLSIDENENILIRRFYEKFPNREIISEIDYSTAIDENPDYNNEYTVMDTLNNEVLTSNNNMIWFHKTNVDGVDLQGTPTKAKLLLDNNITGAYTFIGIWQYDPSFSNSKKRLFDDFFISNEFYEGYYGDNWENINIYLNDIGYINVENNKASFTSGKISVPIKASELEEISIKNGSNAISAFSFNADGSISVYAHNVLIYKNEPPIDFKSWDIEYTLNSTWTDGNLPIKDNTLQKVIIINDSVNLKEIEDFWEYLRNETNISEITTYKNICLQVGEEFEIYFDLLPKNIRNNDDVRLSTDSEIISINGNKITALSNGLAFVKIGIDDLEKEISVYVGKEISETITSSRIINDILIVNPIETMVVGEDYALYAIGLTADNVPYKVTDSNLLVFKSDNPDIISCQFGVITALKQGTTSITVSSLDGTVIKTLEINVINNDDIKIPERDIYRVNDRQFDIYNNMTESQKTTIGIQEAIDYAIENNYKKIIFNKGQYLINGDYGTISIPSNLIVDFNNSEIFLEKGEQSVQGYTMVKMQDVENSTLMNATFYGENYNNLGGSQSNLTFEYSGNCVNCKVVNCHFLYSTGFNVGVSYVRKTITGFKLSNIESGTINDNGVADDSITEGCYRAIDYIDIYETLDTFILGNMQGYQGYLYMSARLYNIYFYDENYKFISMLKNCVQYQSYNKPSNAKYCKIVFFQDNMPTGSDPDFNSIAHICTVYNPTNCKFIDCSFKYAVMTGLSPQGGINLIIDNCLFEDNGTSDPYSHIDWEDGRIHIQGHIVKNCTFIQNETKYHCNIIECNGRDIVFKNNKVIGGLLEIRSESQNTRIYKNQLKDTKINLSSKTDMVYAGNIYTNEPTIGDVLGDCQIIQSDNLKI